MKIVLSKENYLEYLINDDIEIIDIEYVSSEYLGRLINRLVATCYLNNDKKVIYFGNKDLSLYHFIKEKDHYSLDLKKTKMRRFIKIGEGETGTKNNICDVPGVMVGNYSVVDSEKEIHTGVTVISPHPGNIFKEKVVASSYAFNGFGKTIGLVQVEELGTIETKIALTSTLCVNRIAEGIIKESLNDNPEIAVTTGTVNPIVMECNDGTLSRSRLRPITSLDYEKCLEKLDYDFTQGDVGAGCGMVCHGFKGGIGSSSRIIELDNKKYTMGIIVNSNFGSSNGRDLIINGRKMGALIKDKEYEDKGSIVGVLAADLPLNERQLKRLLKRVELGIGRTGSYAGNGSGDVFLGFTTANKRNHFNDSAVSNNNILNDDYINIVFKNVVDMTEEAVLNSMLYSHHVKGFQKDCKSLQEFNSLFSDLFSEVVEYEL